MKSIDLKIASVEVKAETRRMSTDFRMHCAYDTTKIEENIMKEWRNMAITSFRRLKVRKIFES